LTIPTSIKNIIFDFGGVILNIDYKLTEYAFAKLGVKDFDKIYSQVTQKELFDVFEKGLITPSDFRREIRKFISVRQKVRTPSSSGEKISDAQIDDAWNSMLLDLPEERVHLLDELKKKYCLFLLSNTNEIHFNTFTTYIRKKFNREIFSDVFEKVYVSHQVNMRKPDAGIFELVLAENKLKKEETLFIDDSMQHIEGARKAGLNAIFLEKGKTILDLFT
jgi:putative hydrolase of the HAD superfamily